jgi:hypothetical protein
VKKPKPDEIATLGLGEFFACYGTHTTKVYAQPAWMTEEVAAAVARGALDARKATYPQPDHPKRKADHVTAGGAAA